eukprot:8056274-Prorocentrum_lima.AAC.1
MAVEEAIFLIHPQAAISPTVAGPSSQAFREEVPQVATAAESRILMEVGGQARQDSLATALHRAALEETDPHR